MNELFFSIGGFIGAGVAVAMGTAIVKFVLSRLNWPKNETVRLIIACFTLPTLMLFSHANGPLAAIKYFIVAFVVLIAYTYEASRKKASQTIINSDVEKRSPTKQQCGSCGTTLMVGDAFCPNCGKPIATNEKVAKDKGGRDMRLLTALVVFGVMAAALAIGISWYDLAYHPRWRAVDAMNNYLFRGVELDWGELLSWDNNPTPSKAAVTETTSTYSFRMPVFPTSTNRVSPPPTKDIAPQPLRCKTNECTFKGACESKPTYSHCVQSNPTKGWACDTGYVWQNSLCKEIGLMQVVCKMERGDASYFTGEITKNNLVVCGCVTGYHFHSSGWCAKDAYVPPGGISQDTLCASYVSFLGPNDPPLQILKPECPPDASFNRPPIKNTVGNVVY